MTKFNPDFWETTLASPGWERFSLEDGLWHEGPDDVLARQRRVERVEAIAPELLTLMNEVLTDRQHEIVQLYFFVQLNQRQIAELLGISQQSVSEHLYGKARNGRSVGGAIRKLRKHCALRGIRWG